MLLKNIAKNSSGVYKIIDGAGHLTASIKRLAGHTESNAARLRLKKSYNNRIAFILDGVFCASSV
jgi:hypothetical protein